MVNKVYFIGIGGIGISALAQWYKRRGFSVSGSDSVKSDITTLLQKRGIKVKIGSDAKKITPETKLVVYSSAVPKNQPERLKAEKLGIKEQSYAEALGNVTKAYKTIAICGTHGKSTTTAMVALMLKEANLDPTVIVGTLVPQFGNNNFRAGKSDWLVIEADEYKEAFLHHHPFITICTNVEADHLDYYKSYSRVKKAFKKFFTNNSEQGYLIFNKDDKFLSTIKPTKKKKVRYYSILDKRSGAIKTILKVPGRHNLANALAADQVGSILKLTEKQRNLGLARFTGTWRRLEYKGNFKGLKIFDDYAHHPTEIKASLAAVREMFPTTRIWCVFQPHQIDRLTRLFKDFISSFENADTVAILETYQVKGREYRGQRHTALELANKIGGYYLPTHNSAVKFVKTKPAVGDVVILMGAGDINLATKKLLKK